MAQTEKAKKWIQSSTERMKRKGTTGSMTRMASAQGESPREFALSHYHAAGKAGEKARWATNVNHWR
jgi:hypothetical protein